MSTEKPTTIDVYRIDTFSGENNEHGVDRSESWILRRDSFHETLEDAKDHVRIKSRIFTDLPLFLVDLKSDEEKESAVDEFCFTDKYLKYQRYFVIEKPTDIKTVESKIIKVLRSEGVKIGKAQ
ncbi:MAG: hypothetical protein PHG66_01790 [Candidatus Colwellbacteria bacterium]|nr:hypothetical protein [Candidatus Colwellbacteria bacterium]